MHHVVIAAILLGAEPAPPKLAMPGLSVIGIEARYGEFFGEHLAQQLKFEGLEVVTTKEIESLLGFERQKQLLGCGESSSSCIAELASALGADGVMMGDVAKVGGKTQVNLKIISARDGKTLAAYSDRVDGDEAVLDTLTRAAGQLAEGMGNALHRTLKPVELGARGGAALKSAWWAPVAAGAVAIGAGILLFVLGGTDYARLNGASTVAPLSLIEARDLRDGGALKQTLGVVFLGVGSAAVVGGGLWLLLGRTSAPVALVPGRDGATLVFSGNLP